PFRPQQIVVVYGSGVSAPAHQTVAPHALAQSTAPDYTNATGLNRVLKGLGVDRSDRLFGDVSHNRLVSLRSTAEQRLGHLLLAFSTASVLHVTGSSVPSARDTLRANPDVAYAARNWTVTPSNTPAVPVPAAATQSARSASPRLDAAASATAGVPDNFTL